MLCSSSCSIYSNTQWPAASKISHGDQYSSKEAGEQFPANCITSDGLSQQAGDRASQEALVATIRR